MRDPRFNSIPENLLLLHQGEEKLRSEAISWIECDARLSLHMTAIENAMDLADVFRQFATKDEDLKVVQLLAMRTFNAFGTGLKLALSGYFQNGALVMRDTIETVFLLDLFGSDRSLIEKWRFADKQARLKQFSPVKVRTALDARDGFTSRKRAEIYELFSELAGHPNMKSSWMMRPHKDADAVIGPYMEKGTLDATLAEMGRLAVQVGELLSLFYQAEWERAFPVEWKRALGARHAFAHTKKAWFAEFYPRTGSEPGN